VQLSQSPNLQLRTDKSTRHRVGAAVTENEARTHIMCALVLSLFEKLLAASAWSIRKSELASDGKRAYQRLF